MKLDGLDEIRTWPLAKRRRTYANARRLGSPEAVALIAAIDQAGLPPRIDGLTNDDPVTIEMTNIIFSPRGREAAIAAAERGVPALSGVDPMLAAALGDRYADDDLGTATAGTIVAAVMREAGHRRARDGPCEPGRVAKTGAMWLAEGMPKT